MALVNKNVTRTIYNSTEKTFQTMSASADTLSAVMTTSDKLYVGFREKFQCRYFLFGTLNTNAATLTVKYWNGTAYTAVTDLVDQTLGFTRNGFISWTNANDWALKAQTGIASPELYWVEISVDLTLSAGTAIQCIENLFCDALLLRSYYPELVSDTSYLPPGRSDFTEQFVAAKDLVVLRLKQDKIISDESQVLDPNEVCVAAVHATAWMIVNPIARDEGDKERAKEMFDNFNRELNQSKKSFDFDNSGTVDEDEKNVGTVFVARR